MLRRYAWIAMAPNGQLLSPAPRPRLSSDASEIKLVFSIPPHRPTNSELRTRLERCAD
jgi:hypothetical protein